MRNAHFTLAILLMAGTIAAGADSSERSDAELIQGEWQPTSSSENGDRIAQEALDESSLNFSGDSLVGFGKRTLRGHFSLDPAADPKRIDLRFNGENDETLSIQGIYQLDGDKLTICVGADPGVDRPTDFTSASGAKRTLLVLERIPDVVGTWERLVRNESGERRRIVKTHKAGKTTLTVYDGAGIIVHQHQSRYKLRESDNVRTFVFFGMEATAGPAKGQERVGSEAYAYRIQGDLFYEFRGVVLNDETPPAILVWRRVRHE